jgi:hypothetical protein
MHEEVVRVLTVITQATWLQAVVAVAVVIWLAVAGLVAWLIVRSADSAALREQAEGQSPEPAPSDWMCSTTTEHNSPSRANSA